MGILIIMQTNHCVFSHFYGQLVNFAMSSFQASPEIKYTKVGMIESIVIKPMSTRNSLLMQDLI